MTITGKIQKFVMREQTIKKLGLKAEKTLNAGLLLHALPKKALRGFGLGRIVGHYRGPAHAIAGIVQWLPRIALFGLSHGLNPAVSSVVELRGRRLPIEGRGDGAAASGDKDR